MNCAGTNLTCPGTNRPGTNWLDAAKKPSLVLNIWICFCLQIIELPIAGFSFGMLVDLYMMGIPISLGPTEPQKPI